VKAHAIHVNASHTPKEGAHSPSWPTGLIIIMNIINDNAGERTSRNFL
jgi:hypothetical protein